MKLHDMKQITTPASWKQRALMPHAPAASPHPGRKGKLILAAAVIAVLCCGTALASGVYHHYQNGIVVASEAELKASRTDNGITSYSIGSPNSREALDKEAFLRDWTNTAGDWTNETALHGGNIILDTTWTAQEKVSAEGPVWTKELTDDHHHTQQQLTASNPSLLCEAQPSAASWDLSWLDTNYDAVPYANDLVTVWDNGILGKKHDFLGSQFGALYTVGQEGYFSISYTYTIRHLDYSTDYVVSSRYDRVEEYTSVDGTEYLIQAYGNQIWVRAQSPHFSFDIYAADMTSDQIKEILDHLEMQVDLDPANCNEE